VEAQTDLQTYLERGKQALAQGQAREAAIAYAHGAQMEPDNPMVHLGLAEANLALGNYGVVQMACRRVQELQPSGGIEATTAQALLNTLDHRYERALQDINNVVSEDPGIAYAHALRSYLLRATGQDYDANLARARAARLSYGGRFDNDFPAIEPKDTLGYQGNSPSSTPLIPDSTTNGNGTSRPEREAVPTWSSPNQMQRQIIRTRFALSQYPGLVTNILIAINVIVYGLGIIFPSINDYGAQANTLVLQGEYWRIFTAMFLHAGIFHIGLNMLSLFFIGRVVEIMYGKWRYLVIYLLAGIFGGISFLLLSPGEVAVGASGAIFGVFGALGVFYIVNRRAMGSFGGGAISNWIFWLVLNLVLGIAPGSNIAIWAHMGGLVAGMIISFILIPRQNRRRAI
jgi:membrane associated rhomboid family serine protease